MMGRSRMHSLRWSGRASGRRPGLRHVSIPFVLLTVVPAYPGRPGLHLDFAYRLSVFAYRCAGRVEGGRD